MDDHDKTCPSNSDSVDPGGGEISNETLNPNSSVTAPFAGTSSLSESSDICSHQCGLCGSKFTLLVQYLKHRVREHAGQQRSMSCELCGTAYSRQTTLRDHYKKKHRINFDSKSSQNKTLSINQPDKKKIKLDDVQTTENIRYVTSDDNHGIKDDISTKTVHIVITKTEDENISDVLNKNHENVTRGNQEDESFERDGDGCVEQEDIKSADPDRSITDSAEKMEVDKKCSDLQNVDFDSEPKVTYDSLGKAKTETNAIVQEFDENEDFHFVLLKNIINGNSFKYSKDRFQCLHCEFKSYWRNSICTHMRDMHKDMMSIHQYIEIRPPDSDNTNTDQSIIKMSDYMASLRQKKTLNRSTERRIRNVEKQDLPGHFPCSKCDKEFNRLRYLRKHMLVHKTDKKYLCDECGKAFKTRSYLKTHYRTHKERLFKCSQCSFSSSVNAVIHAHRQLHNDGSVICDVCGFAYADKSTLKKHKLVHDPDRPFPCTFPGCTWRFKTKVMCLAHYNAHTSEGKFRCSVCSYVFRHKHHLQRHQSKMHGITNMTNVTIVEEETKEKKREDEEEVSDIPDTVNLIVNSDFSRDQLQSALQNGQLVIATDSEGNTINYEVADITMNVTYHTLLEDESELGDTQTILHVATIDSQEDNV